MSWEIAVMMGSISTIFVFLYITFSIKEPKLFWLRWVFLFAGLLATIVNLGLAYTIALDAGKDSVAGIIYSLMLPLEILLPIIILALLLMIAFNYAKQLKDQKALENEKKYIDF